MPSSCLYVMANTATVTRDISNVNRTHYEVLGVKRDAKKKEIKSAYLKLSKQHHPDLNPGKGSKSAEFNRISEAYAILSKLSDRIEYDYHLYRRANLNDCPLPDSVLAQYWKDGTIYTGGKYDPDKRPYANSSIVLAAMLFALVGGAIQLAVIMYFSTRRELKAAQVHQEAVAHLENVQSLQRRGLTEVQVALDEYKRKKDFVQKPKKLD